MSNFNDIMQQYAEEEAQSSFSDTMAGMGTQESIVPPPAVTPEEQQASFLQRNLDLPLGLGGALAGGAAGAAVGGPIGGVVGSVLGGATGTFGGTVISETQYGNASDIDAYSKAVENAAWSAGLDVVTLGIMSKLKPAWVAMRMKNGQSVEETLEEIVEGAYPAGSAESLEATQKLLNLRGATLLPSQVGSTGMDTFRERIASVGLVSRQTMQENMEAVNDAIQEELLELINRNARGMNTDPYAMGQVFLDAVEEGQSALQSQYVRGLDDVMRGLGGSRYTRRVPAEFILKPIDDYLKANRGEAVDNLLGETFDFIESNLTRLRGLEEGTFPIQELITLDKAFTQTANAMFGKQGSTPNSTVLAELSEVSNLMRETIFESLSRTAPKQAQEYKALKEAYAEGFNELFPKINKAFINGAKDGSYVGLGDIAAKGLNLDKVKALKLSLRRAHAEAVKDAKQTGEAIAVPSFEEANKLFKAGFLSDKLKTVFGENFAITDLRNLAKDAERPRTKAVYQEVLGDDYPRFKQLLNAVIEASESASGDFGTLMLRGMEAKGVKGVSAALYSGVGAAGGVTAATSGVSAPLIAAGAAALYVPQVFANIVTNPQYVNKLIMLTKKKTKDPIQTEIAIQAIVSDALDAMTDSEKADIMNYLSEQAQEQMVGKREEEVTAPPPPTQQELITRSGLINPQRAKMKLQQSLQERGMLTAP